MTSSHSKRCHKITTLLVIYININKYFNISLQVSHLPKAKNDVFYKNLYANILKIIF